MQLSPLLTAFVEAMNSHDSDAVAACFSPDALVEDEGHTYHGTAAIKAWIEAANEKYEPRLEVQSVSGQDQNIVLAGLVSGTFKGSPARLRYHLTIPEDKIGRLAIIP